MVLDTEIKGINFALLHLLDALDSVDYALNSLSEVEGISDKTQELMTQVNTEDIKELRKSIKLDYSEIKSELKRQKTNNRKDNSKSLKIIS